jgi:hypothetical protein
MCELGGFLHSLAVLVLRRARLTRRGVDLGEAIVILEGGTVESLLKDRFGLVELKLGLEVVQVVGVATAVGTTAGIRKVELLVNYFFADTTPE